MTKFPIEVEFDCPDNRITFIRDVLSAGNHNYYRTTIAYKVVGFEKAAPDRDPAFLVEAGLSFCHVQGKDVFTRKQGRDEALRRLRGEPEAHPRNPEVIVQNVPLKVRVYVDQEVALAVYRTLAKSGRAGMEKAHVPNRLIGRFLAFGRKEPKPRPNSVARLAKAKRSAASRNAYVQALAEAKSKQLVGEEARGWAVAKVRMWMGETVTKPGVQQVKA